MNANLVNLLRDYLYHPMTPDIAARIYEMATRVVMLVPQAEIEAIKPEEREGYVFARERLEDILHEMQPLHQAQWDEKEAEPGRPQFNPDYDTFIRHEQAGRALVFTLRKDGRLIGNFSLYVTRSMHTQALRSTEDTLYIVPECRKGRLAARLINYGERGLKQLGVTEINVTVKVANRHGRYFQMLGYNHVSNGLTKYLEN